MIIKMLFSFLKMIQSMMHMDGTSPTEVGKKFCVREKKMKAMGGFGAFSFVAAYMCLVPSLKIPSKFKIHDF